LVQFIIEQQIIDFHVTNKQHTHLLSYNFSDSKQWLFFFCPESNKHQLSLTKKKKTKNISFVLPRKQQTLAFFFPKKTTHVSLLSIIKTI